MRKDETAIQVHPTRQAAIRRWREFVCADHEEDCLLDAGAEAQEHVVRIPCRCRQDRRRNHLQRSFFRGVDVLRNEQREADTECEPLSSHAFDRML